MWSYLNGVYYYYENGVWTGLAWNGQFWYYDASTNTWYYWNDYYQVWVRQGAFI
ncbi:hypothetical protein HPT25_19555 [Bacillus sp. BRMEA1]|uniref:hypothetical protein n=1 Tax=Neobacillus endophyticus TaxID=2738405 RepID=UPI00156608C0|nr:hypothetical protein [Neobacillus endophyticus]NRD79560.1 hypothetical protein [Neobacillus endophyticus]